MNNIDSLIREIQKHEVVEIDGALDKSSLKRIEEKVLNAISEERPVVHKRKRHKRWFVYALVAVFTLALGLSVYAAKENEWDITLINFMGISNANTLQLEDGVVEINQVQRSMCVDYGHLETGEEKEIEIKAASSIGDKNEVYVRIETNYVLPDDFNPETDYILPEDYSLSVSSNSGYGSVFTYFAEDNKLGFLLSISNCQDINRAEISLYMENLYLYHDLQEDNANSEKELLCEGAWDLNWSYHYKSNTETNYMVHPFQSEGVTYYLTKVEVSPISVRMEAFRMPWDRDKQHPDAWLEEIHFSDGTVLQIDGLSGAGMKNGMFAESYIGVDVFGDAIDPEKVEMLVIEGEKISLY